MNIDFTKTDGINTLVDCIVLDDNNTYSDDEIETIKQTRFDNYVTIITVTQTIDEIVDPSVVAVDDVIV